VILVAIVGDAIVGVAIVGVAIVGVAIVGKYRFIHNSIYYFTLDVTKRFIKKFFNFSKKYNNIIKLYKKEETYNVETFFMFRLLE
jgi:hypothetical protein